MKTCSYCGRENEDAAIRCQECGEDSLPPDEADRRLTNPADSLVVVATPGDTVEANLLKDRLERAGIEACVPEELDPSPFGNFPPLAHVTVRVAQKNNEAAKEILAAAPEP
jgi:hypothetical protein